MISKRAQKIKSFIAVDLLEESLKLKSSGADIISFALGEPDFKSPEVVKYAAIDAIRRDQTYYTHSQGLIELRLAIAADYKKKYNVSVDPEQIVVTPGTSPAFFLVFSCLLESGSEVILPNPHYPCDSNYVEFLGGKNRFLKITEEDNYQWDKKQLKKIITRKTRAILVTSPSNPTGTVLEKQNIKDIVATSKRIPIVSDELYHGLCYEEGKEHSLLEFTDNCFVVNGFSKSYSMTGYRLGYVIAPKKYIPALRKIQQNFIISTNTFVQMAGIAALQKTDAHQKTIRDTLNDRRLFMMDQLEQLGFKIGYKPNGAFYIFVKANTKNSLKLSYDILRKAHVAITPGIDFGIGGEGHLRFAYTLDKARIAEGFERLKKYFS